MARSSLAQCCTPVSFRNVILFRLCMCVPPAVRCGGRGSVCVCCAVSKVQSGHTAMCMQAGGLGGIPNLAKMRNRAASATASAAAQPLCAPALSVVSTAGAGGTYGASSRSSVGSLAAPLRGGYVIVASVSCARRIFAMKSALACPLDSEGGPVSCMSVVKEHHLQHSLAVAKAGL